MPFVNQGPNAPTVYTPPARSSYTKIGMLSAGDGSTGIAVFGIPSNAVVTGVYTISKGANASQTVTAGFTASGTEILTAFAPNATGYSPAGTASGSAVGSQVSGNKIVYFKASDTLTNSVLLKVEYTIPPAGQPF